MSLFAGVFVLFGLLRLTAALHGTDHWSDVDFAGLGNIDWTREREIVMAFTAMTIICIPVVALWGFASGFARMLVAGLSAPGLLLSWAGAVMDGKDHAVVLLIEAFICLIVIALLFNSTTSLWLKANREKRIAA